MPPKTKKPAGKTPEEIALYARFLDFKPRKGDLRKLEIIDAAIACLCDEGIHHTTFESIGKRLGIGRAHVAYHFPELEDVFEAAVKMCIATAQSLAVEAVSAETEPKEKLSAFLNATFEFVQRHPQHAKVVLLLYYLASIQPRYRKLHEEVRNLGAQRIEALLVPHLSKKNARRAGELAKLIQTLLTGHLLDFLTTQPKGDLETLRRLTLHQIQTYLDETSS